MDPFLFQVYAAYFWAFNSKKALTVHRAVAGKIDVIHGHIFKYGFGGQGGSIILEVK